jgi:glucosamine 6-phosphate synthetase-like amidotransferase/phosphosugar isomerase protein
MGVKNLIQHYRFTSMADGELTAAVKDIPIDQYMLKYRFAVS